MSPCWSRAWSNIGNISTRSLTHHRSSSQAVTFTFSSLHLSRWRMFWTTLTLNMFDFCTLQSRVRHLLSSLSHMVFRSMIIKVHCFHFRYTRHLFSHNVQYHFYADVTQVCDHWAISEVSVLVPRLISCFGDLSDAFASLRLQLNPSKTNFIWFGSRSNLAEISVQHRSLQFCSLLVQCSDMVRNLGVFFDSELTMTSHVMKVATVCWYYLRRLRHIRSYVDRDVMARLVLSLVITRTDYCNAVPDRPASPLAPLQRVQNAAARLVLGLDPTDEHTSRLRSSDCTGCR